MPDIAAEKVQDEQQQQVAVTSTPSQAKDETYDPNILPDMLPLYYKRLFPHKPFYRWLSYGLSEDNIFVNREISFTLRDDIYLRYLCYESQNELERDICTKCPYKIDIGPVMSIRPKNRHMLAGPDNPVQRELVFDIDMTDYDDVRTCCSGAEVCVKCWKFMSLAARILDTALREDFGFEHIFWVFSGRRGIHCWVCDYEARHLDSRGRACVAEYLQVMTNVSVNNINIPRIQLGDRMHHSVKRAFKMLEQVFEEIILDDQNLFGTPKGVARLLATVADDGGRKEVDEYLRANLPDGAPSRDVWAAFKRFANTMRTNGGSGVWNRRLRCVIEEIQLSMLYPRLDINVTKGFNHLLKAPFCIHPATGKVCVPFSASAAAKFDPTTVPTIVQLLHEINAFDDKSKDPEELPEEKSRIKDYKKTSIFKGVVVFEEFLRKLESSLKGKAIDVSDRRMEF